MALDANLYRSGGAELGELLGDLLPIPFGSKIGRAAGSLGGSALGNYMNPTASGMNSQQQMGQQGNSSSISDFFMGSPRRAEQLPRYSPETSAIFSQLLQQGMKGLQNPQAGFDPIENKARSDFQQKTLPSLLERFTGTGGALSSPILGSQIGAAGAGLEESLAAMRAQFGQQNMSNLMQLLGLGLTPQFDWMELAAEPGLFQQMLPSIGRVGTAALGGGIKGSQSGKGFFSGSKDALADILTQLANPNKGA